MVEFFSLTNFGKTHWHHGLTSNSAKFLGGMMWATNVLVLKSSSYKIWQMSVLFTPRFTVLNKWRCHFIKKGKIILLMIRNVKSVQNSQNDIRSKKLFFAYRGMWGAAVGSTKERNRNFNAGLVSWLGKLKKAIAQFWKNIFWKGPWNLPRKISL